MMTRLFVLLCAIILASNCIGAHQYQLSKSQLNALFNRPAPASAAAAGAANGGGGQGQGEYYVPSYYANRLSGQQNQQQLPSTYQELLLAENLAAEQAAEEAAAVEQLRREHQQQYPSFPSIVRPSIALNGADRLSKYKPPRQQAEPEDEGIPPSSSGPENSELRRWLANIRALQPAVEDRLDALGEYIKARQNQQRQQQQQSRNEGAAEEQENGGYYYTENAAPRGFEDPAIQQQLPKTASSSSKQLLGRLSPYAAEAMMDTNSYEDLQEATAGAGGARRQQQTAPTYEKKRTEESSGVTHDNTGGESSVRSEPKARRKLVDQQQQDQSPSSLLATSRNLVHSPKALYQDKTSSGSSSSSPSSTSLLSSLSDVYFVAVVACVSSVAIFSVIGAGYCFYKVQQSNKAAIDVDFPTYGVIGPASRPGATATGEEKDGGEGMKASGAGSASLAGSVSSGGGGGSGAKCSSPPADRKLAQSAQMYHYHHQKQQMISNEKHHANTPRHNNALANSDVESDEENEDGEYTVYECPGLAPTGEMEVKNPLFQDDLTPMSSPSVNAAAAAAASAASSKDSPKTATVSTSASSKTPETTSAAKKSEKDK